MSDQQKNRVYVYKCCLCGEIWNDMIGCFSIQQGLSTLMEVERLNQISMLGGIISATNYHSCKDGSVGVSDLVGFKDYES
jgi:hypothetical protein